MKRQILKFSVLGILAAALAALPLSLPAQTNQPPAAKKAEGTAVEKKAGGKKTTAKKAGDTKSRALPFRGKLTAVDKMAKTITVGERSFQITSTTRIFKAEKPALLEDGVVGEPVTGSYKTNEDGKLSANTVYYGGKSTGKAGEKTSEKTEPKKAEKKTAEPAK